MEQDQLKNILQSIQKVKIAVIGDFCLDAYWEIDTSTSEKSLETGLETRPVRKQSYAPGGASNVVANLVELGVAEVRAFGVFGEDLFGRELFKIFQRLGVNVEGICVQETDWNTQVFLKPIQDGKELNRFDMGNFNTISTQTADTLLQQITQAIAKVDCIIINQQALKSIHSKYFRDHLLEIVKQNRDKRFITDSRAYANEFDGTIRKINEFELMALSGQAVKPEDNLQRSDILQAARTLAAKWDETLLVTCGEDGVVIYDNQKLIEVPAVKISGEVDTVGAGDSFLSAATATLATGANYEQAAQLGNLAAAVTVQKLLCTGTASVDEILKLNNIQE